MIKKILKFGITILASIGLVTIGINAADNRDDFSQSIVGRLVFGKEKGPCPADMALVLSDKGNFCVDRYEVSAGENCPHLDPQNEVESRSNLNNAACEVKSKSGTMPWRNLTKVQAMTACAKAGKRLPSAEEWFLAALGTPDISSGWSEADCQVDNNWSSQPGLTGSGKNCVSYSGAYDMIGNLWEWVNDEAENGIYKEKPLPPFGYVQAVDGDGLPSETNGETANENYSGDYFWLKNDGLRNIAKGGYWNNQAEAGIYSAYVVVPPSFVGTGVGFRCAK